MISFILVSVTYKNINVAGALVSKSRRKKSGNEVVMVTAMQANMEATQQVLRELRNSAANIETRGETNVTELNEGACGGIHDQDKTTDSTMDGAVLRQTGCESLYLNTYHNQMGAVIQ